MNRKTNRFATYVSLAAFLLGVSPNLGYTQVQAPGVIGLPKIIYGGSNNNGPKQQGSHNDYDQPEYNQNSLEMQLGKVFADTPLRSYNPSKGCCPSSDQDFCRRLGYECTRVDELLGDYSDE